MRATRTIHLGLFLLAGSVLTLEVALTRILSLMLWSHYTFLVISTAILGFGAAGSLLAIQSRESDERGTRRLLATGSLAFAISVVAMLLVVTRFDIDTAGLFLRTGDTLKFVALYALCAVPFFFAGLSICHLLSVYSGQINTIYFADLLGAGAGALVVTVLLNALGAPGTISVCCVMAVVAALLFAGAPGRGALNRPAFALAVLAAVGAFFEPWTVPIATNKPMHGQEDEVVRSRWSLHGRIDVMESQLQPLDFGSGVSPEFDDRPAYYRTVYMDGSNPSRLIRYDQDRWFLPCLGTAGPYAFDFDSPKVAIVGSGGGIDTMMALHFGAREVTPLEINPVTVDLVSNEFGDYIGGIFGRPNVHLLAKEGRHFFTLDDGRYDILRLTGVDTQAAAAAGANAFDHAYLYTTEAIGEFWEHLSDDGILAINRPLGWQGMRLINIFLTAMEELPIEDPAAQLVIVTNRRWCDVLLRRRPYREGEVERFLEWAERVGHDVLHDPFHPRDTVVSRMVRATPEARAQLCASIEQRSGYNLDPITDDSPFLMEGLRLGTVLERLARGDFENTLISGFPKLLLTLVQAILLSALLILLPLKLGKRRIAAVAGRWWVVLYFSLLGMGFILAEMVFIQKYMILLGGPAYAMSITLFSILVFSGLGAFAARRVNVESPRVLLGVFVCLLALLAASAVFMRVGMPHVLGFGFGGRVLVSIASLAPISFAIGFPFPIGIRLLDRSAPDLIPWAWASNACLTVIGSVLCVILSVHLGFSVVLALAGACYVMATLSLLRMVRVEA